MCPEGFNGNFVSSCTTTCLSKQNKLDIILLFHHSQIMKFALLYFTTVHASIQHILYAFSDGFA